MSRAVVLFSGGLDSTVMLALALSEGKECIPISFRYGQKHAIELDAAKQIAAFYHLPYLEIPFSIPWFDKSSLTSSTTVPSNLAPTEILNAGITSTYVPARNTLFLAYAMGVAEMFDADEIHFGCNQLDPANYPDCTPSFVRAFQEVLSQGSKQATQNSAPRLITPLLQMDKTEIWHLGRGLKAPLELTWSCYNPLNFAPCEVCAACVLRKQSEIYPS